MVQLLFASKAGRRQAEKKWKLHRRTSSVFFYGTTSSVVQVFFRDDWQGQRVSHPDENESTNKRQRCNFTTWYSTTPPLAMRWYSSTSLGHSCLMKVLLSKMSFKEMVPLFSLSSFCHIPACARPLRKDHFSLGNRAGRDLITSRARVTSSVFGRKACARSEALTFKVTVQ